MYILNIVCVTVLIPYKNYALNYLLYPDLFNASTTDLILFLVCTILYISPIQNMLKAAAATQKQLHLVKLHEQSKKNLEQEIQNYKEEAQKQRKIIYQLEKERDRYINEASDLTQKVTVHTCS